MNSNFAPMLIRASAGTGKTYNLTNRLISLLAAGEKIERVLATTFTKKAAGEILERLLLRIALATRSEEQASILAEAISAVNFSKEEASKLLEKITQSQHRLQISTQDSFFIRIAKSFPLELNLPLIWEITDPAEIKELRSEAINAVFQTIRGSKERSQFLAILQAVQERGIGNKLYLTLDRFASEMYGFFQASNKEAWQRLSAENNKLSSAVDLAERVSKIEVPKNKNGTVKKHWESDLERITAELSKAIPDFEFIIDKGIAAKIIDGEESFSAAEILPEVKLIFSEIIALARYDLLKALKAKTEALYAFLVQFDQEYKKVKAARGVLLFDDVKNALARYGKFDDVRELYFRIDSTVRHILLDEFQDTSVEEWQILSPLVEETLAHGDQEHTFFCVGDVKQAIYGWRGGEAAIFDLIEESYPQLELKSESHSYRSSPIVIEFANQIFANLQQSEVLSPFPDVVDYWQKRFVVHTAEKQKLEGYVSLTALDTELSAQERELAADKKVVQLVKEIVERNPSASIAVLYRKNASISRMIYLLKKHDISASEEGGNPLTDSKAVTVMLSLLRLAEHPDDGVACFCLNQSPLGAFLNLTSITDKKAIDAASADIRQRIADRGLGATLNYFAKPLWDNLDQRDSERLQLFLDQANGFRLGASARLSQFIKFIEEKRVESATQSLVRVMTIHQSKGLEFDAVILPELDGKLTGSRTPHLLSERESIVDPITLVVAYPNKKLQSLDSGLKALAARQKSATVSESLAVLYVAITRAKQAVYLIASGIKNEARIGDTFSALLLELLSLKDGKSRSVDSAFEFGNKQWRVEKEGGSRKSTQVAQSFSLGLKTPPSRTRHLATLVPSMAESHKNKRDIFTSKTSSSFKGSRNRGSLIHAFFEKISWLDENVFNEEIFKGEVAPLLRQNGGEEIFLDFLQMLKFPVVRTVFIKGERTELYRELPFAFRRGEMVYRGVIDRLAATINNGIVKDIELFDFKTDRIALDDETLLKSQIESYRPQLEIYREASSRLFKVEPSMVQANLLFVEIGKKVALD